MNLENEELRIPNKGGFDIDKEESCILPFNLNLNDMLLKTATIQLITKLEKNNQTNYFFYQPKGMKPELVFNKETVKDIKLTSGKIDQENGTIIVHPDSSQMTKLTLINQKDKVINLYVLTNEQSLSFWKFNFNGEFYNQVSHLKKK